MKVIVAVIAYLLLLLSGQLLWKHGLARLPGVFRGNPIDALVALFSSWWIWSGIWIYGAATLVWLYLLSKYDLSYIYPVTSLTFVLVLLVSLFFLGEPVSWNRWVGVLMICSGVYVVSLR
ncbi:undecaprenyl phosphate-alpha-L-ara4N flippase subunit ArnE [Gammaproteobacteria bacterium]